VRSINLLTETYSTRVQGKASARMGRFDQRLACPKGLAFDSATGTLYIADTDSVNVGRIMRLSVSAYTDLMEGAMSASIQTHHIAMPWTIVCTQPC
jgi:sugar lactone lactonase YvrE